MTLTVCLFRTLFLGSLLSSCTLLSPTLQANRRSHTMSVSWSCFGTSSLFFLHSGTVPKPTVHENRKNQTVPSPKNANFREEGKKLTCVTSGAFSGSSPRASAFSCLILTLAASLSAASRSSLSRASSSSLSFLSTSAASLSLRSSSSCLCLSLA